MNKKTIYIVVAVLVVVIVVAAAGILLMNNNNGGTTNPTPTPAPATVVGASSVQFNVNETTGTSTVPYEFACKNFNTSTEIIRVDLLMGAAGNYTYVMDAHTQTSKMSTDNGTTWATSTFATDWQTYGTIFTNNVDKLVAAGNTNDLTYTSGTTTVNIFCVAVNQAADSLFETSH
jgi:hypothetical protein